MGADGSEQFLSWWDSELEFSCSPEFDEFAEGLRCFPLTSPLLKLNSSTNFFSDPDCEDELLAIEFSEDYCGESLPEPLYVRGKPRPSWVFFGDRDAACSKSNLTNAYRLENELEEGEGYWEKPGFGSSSCNPGAYSRGDEVKLFNATKIDHSILAAFEESFE